ncbi:MAG TPA: DUF4442 domain-containing protein [Candidatus Polarisedimenticolaceae bacterium]|nr:DUF4442 domain-containing protein [Candidatus Polarisedimenticolaceae bacterium]
MSGEGAGERLQQLWDRIAGYPGGRWLFSRLVGRIIPYSGTIAASIVELAPGHARVRIRDRRSVRNHLHSIHAIALLNLGELTTGLALNCGLSSSLRTILVHVAMDYEKKARGVITAECRCVQPDDRNEQELPVTGELRDGTGDVVAVVRAVWRVGPTAPAAG